MGFSTTLGPNGWEPVDTQNADYAAAVVGAAGLRRAGNKCALIGDSIAGYTFGGVTITSAVRASGVLTVTATSHGLVTGGSFALGGVTNDATMNGCYAGTVTRVDANTFTVPSAGSDGTAVAAGGFFGANLQTLSQHGFFGWSQILGGNKLDLSYVGVQGGATVEQIAANYVQGVIASSAAYCVVMCGVNNAASSDTAAWIAAQIQTLILAPLVAAGVRVFLMSIFPFSSSHASFATASPKISVINDALRVYSRTNSSIKFVDAYAALVDPVNATPGNSLAGMMDSSNLHPSAKGARAAGNVLSAVISTEPLSVNDFLMSSNIDAYGANATSTNLLDVGLMQGTGGTAPAGTAPTGWTISTSGTVTAVTGTAGVSRTDGIGSDMQVSIQPGGSNATLLINSQTASLLNRVTPGRWYQFGISLSASAVAASNCSNISAYLGISVDGVSYALGTANGVTSDTADGNDFSNLTFLSVPFFVPSGTTVTLALFYITAKFSAASATPLVLNAGRATLRARPDLQ